MIYQPAKLKIRVTLCWWNNPLQYSVVLCYVVCLPQTWIRLPQFSSIRDFFVLRPASRAILVATSNICSSFLALLADGSDTVSMLDSFALGLAHSAWKISTVSLLPWWPLYFYLRDCRCCYLIDLPLWCHHYHPCWCCPYWYSCCYCAVLAIITVILEFFFSSLCWILREINDENCDIYCRHLLLVILLLAWETLSSNIWENKWANRQTSGLLLFEPAFLVWV